jgi:toxin HigB-1
LKVKIWGNTQIMIVWQCVNLGREGQSYSTERLDDLRAAETLEEVRHLPGHYHEMRGNRKGQWACDLDQPYRMIFVPHENPIPANKDAQYVWLEIQGVEIVEIVNYHKEGSA